MKNQPFRGRFSVFSKNFVEQEIYAALTAFNFTSRIVKEVVVRHPKDDFLYNPAGEVESGQRRINLLLYKIVPLAVEVYQPRGGHAGNWPQRHSNSTGAAR